MASDRMTIRLDEETHRRIDAEAQATGKNGSELVREALAAYFRQRSEPETCLELAHRAGVIGCAVGLPRDLSTNREYFEGFGR
jgi:hypothetical protein